MPVKDYGTRKIVSSQAWEWGTNSRNRLARGNEYFTHFNAGTTVPAGLVLTEEGTTTAAATYGIGLGGEATITSDDVIAKSDQLTTGLLWEADRQSAGQPLVFETRVKVGTLAANEYWFGLTDNNPDTDPIALSTTSTFTTSVPTNGVYIGYSDTPTSGAAFTSGGNGHTAISINTDVNTVVATSHDQAVGEVSELAVGKYATATYYTYRIEVDLNGNAAWFINGTYFCGMGAAVAKNVPLCAMLCATPRTTASAAITADYLYIGGA